MMHMASGDIYSRLSGGACGYESDFICGRVSVATCRRDSEAQVCGSGACMCWHRDSIANMCHRV